jgi:hypothetical protein
MGRMAHYFLGGKSYYIIYTDGFPRWCEVYFLNGKSADEIFSKFEHYKAQIEAQGFKIKRFRCDNSKGEFSNDKFLQILAKDGISFEPSPPYTQHKNGVAERMIRNSPRLNISDLLAVLHTNTFQKNSATRANSLNDSNHA